MSWLSRLFTTGIKTTQSEKKDIPEGLWVKCSNCSSILFKNDLSSNLNVCTKCNFHMPVSARERLKILFDDNKYQEISKNVVATDILSFKDTKKYKDRLDQARLKTGEKDALVCGMGTIFDRKVIIAAFEFKFIGGSMGRVVGEKFYNAAKIAIEHKCPFICISASGGARMQESIFSLNQMAKTSLAINELAKNNLPYISVLTNPTTGGVSASLAMLGDINIAEPNALIGFAGPNVIRQTVKEELPEGFQRSEFLKEHGSIDVIVDRRELKTKLSSLLGKLVNH